MRHGLFRSGEDPETPPAFPERLSRNHCGIGSDHIFDLPIACDLAAGRIVGGAGEGKVAEDVGFDEEMLESYPHLLLRRACCRGMANAPAESGGSGQ